jgi:CRISPR-associated RAMP protein (TIGR02581 family)
MNATLFDTFNGRLRMEGLLTTRTGLHIGAGGSGDPLATDLPVVRDGSGRPYIPGSSLKGVLRSATEALLRGAPFAGKSGEPDLWACQMMSGAPCVTHEQVVELREKKESEPGREAVDAGREVAEAVWKESCTVCRLFGSLAMASRVRFPDLPLVGDLPGMELRNGVGIDRDKGLAADKVLYDFEAVPPGTSFRLTVILDNPEDSDAGLLLYLFHEMDQGNLALGGKTSRGLGQVRVAWESLVETSLRHGNPFADLLSSRDLLEVAAPVEAEKETASVEPVLPATGDPAAWKALADLLLELPKIDNDHLGAGGKERGLSKENLNEKLGMGLEGRQARKPWDNALKRLEDCGFLIKKGEEWVPAARAEAEEKARPAEEPARKGAIQDVIDRFVGALARRWQEAC